MEKRQCPECDEVVVGRMDKKFCSDACRNAFNNKVNAPATNYIRNVNNLLARNRRILKRLNPSGKTELNRDDLLREGFDFDYYTHQVVTQSGETYCYCYEQGYLNLTRELVLLVEDETAVPSP